MSSSTPRVIRLFCLDDADCSRILQVDDRYLDLSAHLNERGMTVGVIELLAGGFFTAEKLLPRLAQGHWPDAQWRGPEAEPDSVGLPLDPRDVGKILALGKNFRAHAAEFGEAVPDELMFFNKLPETLTAHAETVEVPSWYDGRFDHEVELAVLIGRRGKNIPVESAMEHVAGYAVANDLTMRSLQGHDRKLKYPWFRAKNTDKSCPLGPCLVPRDFLDVSDLRLEASVNGEIRQHASTADFVVDIPHALSTLSRHLTLRAGDIVLTGTPEGVGPLEDGDEVVCEIEGIGRLMTRIARN